MCLLELEKGLNKAFIETLRGVGLNLAKDVVAEITSNKIEITVLNEKGSKLFGSGVTLYLFGSYVTINFGTTGSFTAEESAPYWRTVHAAEILKNWDAVCEIVVYYIQKYIAFKNMA